MSTNYFIYTEVKLGDKWVCIDPIYPRYKIENGDIEKTVLQSTYWNGSYSYFHSAWDKLFDLGVYGKWSDLSDTLKEHYAGYIKDEKENELENTFYNPTPLFVNYLVFNKYVNNRNKSQVLYTNKNRGRY